MKNLSVLTLLFAGCSAAPEQSTTCNAKNWESLVGQPEEAIYGALGNLRVVHAGDAETDDINPDRLNAEVGPDGRVTRFACY